jgi:hypothetical protein
LSPRASILPVLRYAASKYKVNTDAIALKVKQELVAETGRRVGRKLNCIRGEFLESAKFRALNAIVLQSKAESSLKTNIHHSGI